MIRPQTTSETYEILNVGKDSLAVRFVDDIDGEENFVHFVNKFGTLLFAMTEDEFFEFYENLEAVVSEVYGDEDEEDEKEE